MKVLVKLVFGTLGCVLLISGIAVLSPRAVHAVVATIIRDQDNPARHAFTTQCVIPNTTGAVGNCFTPVIPGGEEVVIETISYQIHGDPSNSTLVPFVDISGVPYGFNPIFDAGIFRPTNSFYSGVISIRLYSDPGIPIICEIETQLGNPAGLGGECTFSGYFVTLP